MGRALRLAVLSEPPCRLRPQTPVSSEASFFDLVSNQPYTALPIIIFNFARQPQEAFVALTAASIVVLLVMLLSVNAVAVLMRDRFERRYR